jgi:LmbE family N-acetylglucosaminyl deacetylase
VSPRLAAVFAHPDDDTFGIAGTVALHADEAGFAFAVVLATSGEAGRIADASLATPETLGAVREAEDRASWEALGARPELLAFLRYPDGRLGEVPRGELRDRVADLLVGFRPEVVVTFGPEGVTGHADHVAVGAAADEAFHLARERAGAGFSRLLHVCLPASLLERFGELLRERGIEPPDPTQPFQPRGVPDGEVAVSVDCRPVLHRKLAAIREHRTQAELEEVPEDLWGTMLGSEHFAQAWPPREPGAPVLRDVFEGLPG